MKNYLLLGIVVIVAIFFRFWQLGDVPASPDWDEAALGYNAYSIMQTGKDEYGKFLPVVLRSFDDYKPALYAYFIIPFIKIFDLSVLSVRLPSAVFGVLTVVATFFLVKELFDQKKYFYLPFLASFLLAISPWHVQFSRIGFESNVGVAFNVFAVLFFILGLRKNRYILFSVFLMAVNLYIYQSEKVFTPLIAIVLLFIFRKEFFLIPKKVIGCAVLIGLVTIIPLLGYTLTSKEVFARAKGVSVFSDQTSFLKSNAQRIQKDKENRDYFGLIIDNRRLLYVKSIFSGYLSHYDLNWLFLKGDIARHHAPNMGLLYLFELPFLFIGVFNIVFGSIQKKTKQLLLGWFLLAPIPASITSGVPHAVRTLNFLPTFQIFVALGIISFVIIVNENISSIFRKIVLSLIAVLVVFNILFYLDQYFVQQNYFNSKEWQYGYSQTVSFIDKNQQKYNNIVVTNEGPLDQSYMFFLFYLKYQPLLYLLETKDASGGFRENHSFGKFHFRPIDWAREIKDSETLFVGRPQDFPNEVNSVLTVNYLDGQSAIKVVKGSQ